ncbi:hypothetical protein AX16_005603 [Volvariella volvacea WC 439]|nr:hypothetical protein AX16_005603 [Volvariella volvacea WC 439]
MVLGHSLSKALAWTAIALAFLLELVTARAFSNDRKDNLAVYWGQASAGRQQRLSFYCQDDIIDVIPMAFLYIFFGEGGLPVIDFANICSQSGSGTFPGTRLADCSFLESDIRTCQARGKILTLSLGGATAEAGFTSDSQARQFAKTIWDLFLGGRSSMRPFGDAILDGVDLDIESGSPAHYAAFVNELRSLSANADKRYYITAAPQCPFPDAKIGGALSEASFDAVYVQFYNNYCQTSVPSEFNFDVWDRWARTESPNPNIKVYIGAPASADAAGSGYVRSSTLIEVAKNAQQRYSSFGGVMLWDADQAYTNNRYDVAIKNALVTGDDSNDQPVTTRTPRPQTSTRQPSHPSPTTRQSTGNSGLGTPTPSADTALTTEPVETESFRDPRATGRVKFWPTFVEKRDGKY